MQVNNHKGHRKNGGVTRKTPIKETEMTIANTENTGIAICRDPSP